MARKNSNGFGSIRSIEKNGRLYWQGRFTNPVSHKQCSVNARTEKECSEKLLEMLARIQTGTFASVQRVTVAEWFRQWLADKKYIEPGTRENYRRTIELHIIPALGNAKLSELKRVHCQQFVNGIDLAAKTVHNIAGVLSAGLQDALKQDLIVKNPAAALELPRIVKKPPVAMETAPQRQFEEAFHRSKYGNVYLVALHTGARISEVLGLQWGNVNMKTGKLQITGQLERKSRTADRARKDTTKSHKDRYTYLPPFVLAYLKDERQRQLRHQLKAGPLWNNPDDLIFTREDGSPIPHRTVEHAFDRIKAAVGHPEFTLHSLRKTYITNEEQRGADIKATAASTGHSGLSVAMDHYIASTDEILRKEALQRQILYENQSRLGEI